jgi:hypothetical protein
MLAQIIFTALQFITAFDAIILIDQGSRIGLVLAAVAWIASVGLYNLSRP